MASIERVINAATNGLAVAGLSLLLLFAGFTLTDGLLRSLANMPLDFVRDVGEMIAAICGACCLPIALLTGSNIVLKALGGALPAPAGRMLDVFAGLIIEAVVVGMAWQFWLHSVKTMRAGEITWMYSLPKAPFWFVVDAVLWVAVAVQTYVLICDIVGIKRDVHSETEL
jgi:hypothetical protein